MKDGGFCFLERKGDYILDCVIEVEVESMKITQLQTQCVK